MEIELENSSGFANGFCRLARFIRVHDKFDPCCIMKTSEILDVVGISDFMHISPCVAAFLKIYSEQMPECESTVKLAAYIFRDYS